MAAISQTVPVDKSVKTLKPHWRQHRRNWCRDWIRNGWSQVDPSRWAAEDRFWRRHLAQLDRLRKRMERTMAKKTTDYVETICNALKMHGPCRAAEPRVRGILAKLLSASLPTPTDFDFGYTGSVEFRWHNGDPSHFGTSKMWAGIILAASGTVTVRGTVKPDGADYDRGRIEVCGLDEETAVALLVVLVPVVMAAKKP